MSLEFVGYASGTGAASAPVVSLTSLTGGIDTAAREGDLVIAVNALANNTTDPPCGVTSPSGYIELSELYAAGSSRRASLSVNWKVMGSTPDASVTLTAFNGSSGTIGMVHVWRGADPTTPIDVAIQTATGTGNQSPNPPSITPSTAGAVILVSGGACGSSPGSFTTPSGWGNVMLASTDPGYAILGFIASQAWAGGAVDPALWDHSADGANEAWCAATLAIRPDLAIAVALTGEQATASAGSMAPAVNLAVSGVPATLSAGDMAPSGNQGDAVAGVSSNGLVGTVLPGTSMAIAGVAAAGAVGTLGNFSAVTRRPMVIVTM